jgi:hypothetical protein
MPAQGSVALTLDDARPIVAGAEARTALEPHRNDIWLKGIGAHGPTVDPAYARRSACLETTAAPQPWLGPPTGAAGDER